MRSTLLLPQLRSPVYQGRPSGRPSTDRLSSTTSAVAAPVEAVKLVKLRSCSKSEDRAPRILPETHHAGALSNLLVAGVTSEPPHEQATGCETEPKNSLTSGHDVVSQHGQLADQACC